MTGKHFSLSPDVTLIEVSGNLDDGSVADFGQQLREFLIDNRRVIVDLTRVKMLSAKASLVLRGFAKRLKLRNGFCCVVLGAKFDNDRNRMLTDQLERIGISLVASVLRASEEFGVAEKELVTKIGKEEVEIVSSDESEVMDLKEVEKDALVTLFISELSNGIDYWFKSGKQENGDDDKLELTVDEILPKGQVGANVEEKSGVLRELWDGALYWFGMFRRKN